MEEITEINKNQIPQDILELHNIKSNRIQNQEYFKHLCKRVEMENYALKKYKKKLLHKVNLTG